MKALEILSVLSCAVAVLAMGAASLAAEELRVRADMPSMCKSLKPQIEMGSSPRAVTAKG